MGGGMIRQPSWLKSQWSTMLLRKGLGDHCTDLRRDTGTFCGAYRTSVDYLTSTQLQADLLTFWFSGFGPCLFHGPKRLTVCFQVLQLSTGSREQLASGSMDGMLIKRTSSNGHANLGKSRGGAERMVLEQKPAYSTQKGNGPSHTVQFLFWQTSFFLFFGLCRNIQFFSFTVQRAHLLWFCLLDPLFSTRGPLLMAENMTPY